MLRMKLVGVGGLSLLMAPDPGGLPQSGPQAAGAKPGFYRNPNGRQAN
jgi:N-methylhydantoinase A/oxoprolinase/acetone carboxylase beta subunit